MLILPVTASAEYFFDQGFGTAVVRTDFNETDKGTSTNPLTLSNGNVLYPCNDPILVFNCLLTSYTFVDEDWPPDEYENSHFWSFNGGDTANNFWVLSLNNEPWWWHNNTTGVPNNSGPPNQSLSRVEPGAGIMGFKPIISTEAGENFYRAHMVLNHTYTNPGGYGQNSLPFMSIGAADNRGNGGILGYMNDDYSPSMVTWTSTIFDTVESSPPTVWASAHFIVITAEWDGKTRMIQLALFHEGDIKDSQEVWGEFHWSTSTNGGHNHWNWQIQESFYYPGADIVFFDAEDMYSLCGFPMTRLRYDGTSAYYSLILDDLYRCASDLSLFDTTMPYTSVPITGIQWGNELVGPNIALWTSVHNMRMRLPPDPCPLCRSASQPQSTEIYPPVAAGTNEIPNEVSLIAERLRSSCEQSAKCWNENKLYLEGRRRERSENPNKFVGTFHDILKSLNSSK